MTQHDELEDVLLGGPRRYTRGQVADLSGVPPEVSIRLWRALGFADVGDDDVVFTEADVEALRKVLELIEAGVVDDAAVVTMTRAMGQTLSRLAEWEVEALADLGRRGASGGTPDLTAQTARELLPVLEELMGHVWRRHLLAASGRILSTPAEELTARPLGVGFADLVGFTSLTRQLGEAELAGLVDRFEGMAADVVAERHGRVVKTVGDEVLFVGDTPVDVAEVGLALAAFIGGDDDELPPVRVGMAFGSVVTRLGDVYGSPVNLAARLTSLARPGTVLVDRDLAAALEDDSRYEVRRIRRRSVRGFDHLEPYVLRRSEGG